MKESTELKPTREERLALVILVREILDQLDEIAYLKSQGAPARISKVLLKEMGSVLRQLEPHLQQHYFEVLLGIAGKAKPLSRRKPDEKYVQASRPAKEKIIDELSRTLLHRAI